jgi:hypothetical protein
MSLGNYIYFLPSLQLNKFSANGLDMAPTPFVTLTLSATGFGSGSAVNIGALTLGTVKILFGWFTYTYSGTSNYTATQQLSNQSAFDYQTEALVQARLDGVPENTDIIISTDGVIVPTPGGQNTGNSEPTLLEVVQPEIPTNEQSLVVYTAVDVNNSTGNNEVTLMALTTEQPDPLDPNLIEPIPPGDYEPVSDSDFSNNITANETNVIAYDEQTDSYLVVPESETIETENDLIPYSTYIQLPFFFATQPTVLLHNTSLSISMTSSNNGTYYDTLSISFPPASSTSTGSFLFIGV